MSRIFTTFTEKLTKTMFPCRVGNLFRLNLPEPKSLEERTKTCSFEKDGGKFEITQVELTQDLGYLGSREALENPEGFQTTMLPIPCMLRCIEEMTPFNFETAATCSDVLELIDNYMVENSNHYTNGDQNYIAYALSLHKLRSYILPGALKDLLKNKDKLERYNAYLGGRPEAFCQVIGEKPNQLVFNGPVTEAYLKQRVDVGPSKVKTVTKSNAGDDVRNFYMMK